MIYTNPCQNDSNRNNNLDSTGAAHSPGFGPILFHNTAVKGAGGGATLGMRSHAQSVGSPIPVDIPMLPQAALSPSSPGLSGGQSSSRSSSRGIRQGA